MKRVAEETLYDGKWLILKEATMAREDGKTFKWEYLERSREAHAVVVIPKMIPSGAYLIIEEYRAAIDCFVLAFPAGLTEGDDIAEDGLRELLEETGYHGKILSVGPIVNNNPAITNTTFQVARGEIDTRLPLNQNPVQRLEDQEQIIVHEVLPENIDQFLQDRINSGVKISPGVYYFFQSF